MRTVLVTNCTARQSISPPPNLTGSSLPVDLTTEEAAAEWSSRLKQCETLVTPAQLYRGISFYSIVRAQEYVDADNIYVASTGQGLVRLTQPIAPYDLTLDRHHLHSLHRVVTKEPLSSTIWWRSLNKELRGETYPIAKLAEQDIDLVLVACNNRYLGMVSDDLVNLVLNPVLARKLVVLSLSSQNGVRQLLPWTVSYDRRINTLSIGNRYDAVQRAAVHFLGLVSKMTTLEPIPVCQLLVSEALDSLGVVPTKVVRTSRKRIDIEAVLGKAAKANKQDAIAALSALESIESNLQQGSSAADEERGVAALVQFLKALKSSKRGAVQFTSSDVASWAAAYFSSTGKETPLCMSSPKRVGQLLRVYYSDLGCTRDTQSAHGQKRYSLS